jgi:hypothetical protein
MGDLLHELLKKSVPKMLPPIIDDGTWCPKMYKHIFFQKLNHNSMIIGLASIGLHPFGNIINYHKNVEVPIRIREGSHEVDASNIKKLHYKDRVQWHHVPSSNAPQILVSLIS